MVFCNLSGKNIIVTGASSGLGRAACLVLSRLGAKICLVGRDETALKKTLSAMEGDRHFILPFDLRDFSKYDEMFTPVVSALGRMDGLVHFAGIRKTLPLKVMKSESLREIFEINYFAFIELIRFFTKKSAVNPGGASIIGVSSVASVRGTPALTGYGSSKAALDAAVRSLACELASKRIRVNSIAPGHVETEMNLEVKKTLSAEAYEQIIKSHPLGVGDPADVANLTAFLLSDEARWITGTTIFIDGGFAGRS